MFRSRETGQITIVQVPNTPLVIFLLAWVLRVLLDPSGSVRTALDVIGLFALVVWALDEIIRGVNPWRRLLGAAVLGGMIAALL